MPACPLTRPPAHRTAADHAQIVAEHEPLARYVTGKLMRRAPAGHDPDDSHQDALVGLWEAARLYDPARGVPWSAFAALCIRRKVLKNLGQSDPSRLRTDGRPRDGAPAGRPLSLDWYTAELDDVYAAIIGDRHETPVDERPVDRDEAERLAADVAPLLTEKQMTAVWLAARHGPTEAAKRLGVNRSTAARYRDAAVAAGHGDRAGRTGRPSSTAPGPPRNNTTPEEAA